MDRLVSYADGFTVFIRCRDHESAAKELSEYLSNLHHFLTQHELEVSLGECSTTYFTPWNKEFKLKPAVTTKGVTLDVKNNPKTLGFTLDKCVS